MKFNWTTSTMMQNCECKSWMSIHRYCKQIYFCHREDVLWRSGSPNCSYFILFYYEHHQIVVLTLKYQAVLYWHHSLNWKLLLVYMWWLLYLAFNMSVLSALWSFCSWLCQKLSFYYYTLLNHFSAFQWQIIFSAIACSLKLIIGCWQFHQIMVVILHMSHLN